MEQRVDAGRDKFEAVRTLKLERLAGLGVDPWGGRFADRKAIGAIRELAPAESGATTDTRVRAAGRVMSVRDKGKIFFIDLLDKTGRIQLYLSRDQLADDWPVVKLIDLWDLVGVDGRIGRTKTGEVTIFADRVHFLTKTLAHPPEKYHKARDVELLLRRRYIDMIQDPEVLRRFETRARIVTYIRRFLDERGFVEVETPTMQALAGGAAARPFVTHHNALDTDFYLRIALELYLKRLLVGGMERVYEIGRVFRNEGIDASHNPEFTMLELYEAYGNFETMMELTESAVVGALQSMGRDLRTAYGETAIDFTPPWRRATYDELLRSTVGVGLGDDEGLRAAATKVGLETAGKHPDVIAHDLFEHAVEQTLVVPVFVKDYPASLCPLTKRKAGDDRVAERFELYVAGMEVANAYTELNNPLLQEALLAQQLAGLPEEDSMAKVDADFVLALKHGMPPAGGLGIGIDRLVMLLTNSPTIRDVIIFPLLRPQRPTATGGDAEDDDRDELGEL